MCECQTHRHTIRQEMFMQNAEISPQKHFLNVLEFYFQLFL